jgi:hypothetical protein
MTAPSSSNGHRQLGFPDASKSSRTTVNAAVALPNVSHIHLKRLFENEKKYPVECDFKFRFHEFISALCY